MHALDLFGVLFGLLDHLVTHVTLILLRTILFHSSLHRVDLRRHDVQLDKLALLSADLLQFVCHGVVDIAVRTLVSAHHQHDVAQCRVSWQTPVLDGDCGGWHVLDYTAVDGGEELVVSLNGLFYNRKMSW
jgi:hypothetical protein